jgi:hypothetical protein
MANMRKRFLEPAMDWMVDAKYPVRRLAAVLILKARSLTFMNRRILFSIPPPFLYAMCLRLYLSQSLNLSVFVFVYFCIVSSSSHCSLWFD